MAKSYYDTVQEKLAKGEEPTQTEKLIAGNYDPNNEPVEQSYNEFLKSAAGELYARFGEDVEAYQRYYDENYNYFYGGFEVDNLEIDEDAKAWGIANNDTKLLDKAITCLEKGDEVARAKRILERYTLCDFDTPSEWRKWFNSNKKKLFFTESGGWFFLVNDSPTAVGNDYSILEKRKAMAEAAKAESLSVGEPDDKNPVIVSSRASEQGANEVEVTIQLNIMPSYHIYKVVSDQDPYLPLKLSFDLPGGCKLMGEPVYPVAKGYGTTGTTMFEGKIVIKQLISCKQVPESIGFTISFQCCNETICFPPEEKHFEVAIKK